MQGPTNIDPSKLDAARKAYQDDLAANHPGLVDNDGASHAGNPFDVAADGSVSFNRWTDNANRRSAQDTFVSDYQKDRSGNDSRRIAAWQSVPSFYNNESKNQFDYISKALGSLQSDGFQNMQDIYKKAMKGIR